jgi:TrmH family RNA methyltransferase
MIITSVKNPRVKHVLGLIDRRSTRNKHKQFFVEGVRAVNGAYENGWQVDELIYCPDTAQSDWARDIIARTERHAHLQVDEHIHAKISQRTKPSELMLVVAQAQDDLSRIPISDKLLVVLLDRPQSPGNLGSLIRSCDALGADGLLIIGHAVDLYAPRTVRASMGSFFTLPAIRLDSFEMLETWLNKVRLALGHVHLVGSSAHAETVAFDHDLTAPTVLALGNEMQGMSYRLSQMCDVNLMIPMFGSASSLNMSTAASILLYEVARQRLASRSNP